MDTIVRIADDCDIIIVEGYEFVGKSHVANLLIDELSLQSDCKVLMYRPDYELVGYDTVLDRKNRYILGLPVIELFGTVMKSFNGRVKLMLDRSVFSSYVYSILYNSATESEMMSVFEVYQKVFKDYKVLVVQVSPYTKDSSELLYTQSLSDDQHKDKYDKFENFDEYFSMLTKVEALYLDSFQAYNMMYPDEVTFVKYYNKLELETSDDSTVRD